MRIGFAVFAMLAACATAEDIRVEKLGAEKVSLNMTGVAVSGAGATTFRDVLTADLEKSGWFTLVSQRGTILVTGACSGSDTLKAECSVVNASTGQKYLTRTYSEEAEKARRLAHKVADDIVQAVKGVRGMASSQIVFVGKVSGKKDLFVCDYDGAMTMQITRDGRPCVGPNWFPDNKRIVYTSFLRGDPDVYVLDTGAWTRRMVANYAGLNAGASISPDGRKMALTLSKDGNPDLYVADPDGKNLVRLTRTAVVAETSPSWSPDGSQIVYVGNSSGLPQLYVISVASGQSRRLTMVGSENVAPDWGANGLIAYCSRQGGAYRICVTEPAKGRDGKIITGDDANYEDPSWAPDGRHLVCGRSVGFKSELCVLDMLGDKPVRLGVLTRLQGECYSPSWSK